MSKRKKKAPKQEVRALRMAHQKALRIPATDRRQSYITADERAAIRKMINSRDEHGAPCTLREVAEKFNVSISSVARIRDDDDNHGPAYKPPLSEDVIKSILERRKNNESWLRIGRSLQRSPGFVYNSVKRYCWDTNTMFI